MILTQKQKSV